MFLDYFAPNWGMWDFSFLTRDRTCTPFTGRWNLNHWRPREVLSYVFLITQHPADNFSEASSVPLWVSKKITHSHTHTHTHTHTPHTIRLACQTCHSLGLGSWQVIGSRTWSAFEYNRLRTARSSHLLANEETGARWGPETEGGLAVTQEVKF